MIRLKNREDIEKIRLAGRIIKEIFESLKGQISPGVKTADINSLIEEEILKRGGRPAFKGYRDYPYASCISVNDEVVHGMPSKYVIREGDIVSIDIGVEKDGYYADSAFTFAAGQIDETKQKLLEATEAALARALEVLPKAKRIGDLSYAIQRFVEKKGFSVVRDFVGHGTGFELHEAPAVPNFGRPSTGALLKSGMVLAIEPMVNLGRYEVVIDDNGWTVRTKDGSPSAHFEHTVALWEGAVEVLTG